MDMRLPATLFMANAIALFLRGRAAMFAIHALDTWKEGYVPGSIRKSAKYNAPIFVVAMVMMIPTIATRIGTTMCKERSDVRSEFQVFSTQKIAATR